MVTRARGAAVLAVASLAAAGGGRRARAEEHELAGGLGLTAVARLALAYDDHALLGRRGQFLGSAALGGDSQDDVAAVQSLDAELSRRLRGGRVVLSGRLELAELRTTDELEGWDVRTGLAYERALAPRTRMRPALSLAIHRELPGWSYRLVEPSLYALHTFDVGVMASFTYRFTAQDFARGPDGVAEPKNSYANIDLRGHAVELDLRQWIGRRMRARLLVDLRAADFAGNLSPNLADYAGLAAGTPRADRGGGATGALALTPGRWVVVEAGARWEINRSNSDAFSFTAVHALASVLVTLASDHELLAQLDYGRFDYHREQFDRRYANTRLDWRRDLALVYRYRVSDRIGAGVALRRLDAVSNDCADFDPQRDAAGLPVNSRSYSCYGRSRFEASVTVQL